MCQCIHYARSLHPVSVVNGEMTVWFICSVLSPVNKTRRMELSKASLLKVAPTADERTLVHSLFLNTLDTKYETLTHTHTHMHMHTHTCINIFALAVTDKLAPSLEQNGIYAGHHPHRLSLTLWFCLSPGQMMGTLGLWIPMWS